MNKCISLGAAHKWGEAFPGCQHGGMGPFFRGKMRNKNLRWYAVLEYGISGGMVEWRKHPGGMDE